MHGRVGAGSRTMADLIVLAAARQGGKPALMHKVDGEWVEVSYRQLEGTVRELALGLVDLGIEPGDRVAILSHTRPEWTYACFATFAAGAIVVSVYQTNSAEECRYVLHHSGARAVFVEDAEQLAKVRAVEADLPALELVIVIDPADADGSTISLAALRERARGRSQTELEERLDSVTPDAQCLFLYTSGTTGPPKACELTHGNYRAITSALETRDLVREDDCVYLFLPLAHALALIVQFLVVDVGATLAYWEKDPQKIVANLMELKPMFFPSVPRIFEKIHTLAMSAGDARELEQATRVGMAVRQAQHRGEQVPTDLQAAFERRRAGPLRQRAQTVRRALAPGGDRGGADRSRHPGVLLRLRRAGDGGLRDDRDGQRGERQHPRRVPVGVRRQAAARGPGPDRRRRRNPDQRPQYLQGLLPDANATRETLVDGWLHTGDLGDSTKTAFCSSPPPEGHHHHRRRQEHYACEPRARAAAQPLEFPGRRTRRRPPLPVAVIMLDPKGAERSRASTTSSSTSSIVRVDARRDTDGDRRGQLARRAVEQISDSRFSPRTSQPPASHPNAQGQRSIVEKKSPRRSTRCTTSPTTASSPSRLPRPLGSRVVHG